ncbi:MAG: N-acetylneuraminate synthase family protein [Spirochaetes bacterium]|nr:N-acetylneuraminate synthase family protein [Spirochaetota bacterium]
MKNFNDIFKNKQFVFIAEIGLNHNGDFKTAMQMVEKAAEAGADAVKFQTFVPENMNSVYTSSLVKYGMEKEKSSLEADFFRKFLLKKEAYVELKRLAGSLNMVFFSSPFDVPSVDFLEDLNVELYKIASSEVTNHILIERIAETKKCVIMSTGISTEDEISLALDLLVKNGTPQVVLLHCVSLYPLPPESVNLKRIISLKNRFNLEVGFSDHSNDSKTAEMAAVLGSRIFEKHFTLSSDYDCPDRAVSFDPGRFKKMCENIKSAEIMMGDGHIGFKSDEKEVAKMARRSLYASRFIPEGKILDIDDIVPKRPGTGIPVYKYKSLTGKKSNRNIEKDFLLREEYFD